MAIFNLWLKGFPDTTHNADNLIRALLFLAAGGAIAFTFQRQRNLQDELQKALELAESRLAAVETSESRYRLAFEGAQLGFANLSVDDRLTQSNRRLSETLGYSGAELGQIRIAGLFLPDDSKQVMEVVERMRAGQSASYSSEFEMVRKDKSKVWTRVSLSTQAAETSPPHRIFVVVEDISEHREAREALREEKEWLDLVLSAGRLGTWQMDLRQGTVSGSRTFWKFFGLAKAKRRPLEELSTIVHPADWQKFIGSGAEGATNDYDAEIRICRPDQNDRWIALRGRDEERDGRMVRIGVAADLTSRRETTLLRAIAKKQEYIVLELRHRLSNLFPVVVGLVNMLDGSDTDVAGYKEALIERIRALEATHNLLLRHSTGSGMLRDIVLQALKPYRDTHSISISGPAVLMSDGAAESFAMVVHELTTNSVKHGALGVPDGRLTVQWTAAQPRGDISFEWVETGRKNFASAPRRGFGSSIIGLDGAPLIGHSPKLEDLVKGIRYTLQLPRNGLKSKPGSL